MHKSVVLITGGLTGIGRANVILFIASDETSFITGYVLNVDGGKTAG